MLAEPRRAPILVERRALEQRRRARSHVRTGFGVLDGLEEPSVDELRRLDHLGGGVDREARDADVERHLVQLGAGVLYGPHVDERLDGVTVESAILGGQERVARGPLGAAHDLLEALPPVVEVVRRKEDITVRAWHEEVEVRLLARGDEVRRMDHPGDRQAHVVGVRLLPGDVDELTSPGRLALEDCSHRGCRAGDAREVVGLRVAGRQGRLVRGVAYLLRRRLPAEPARVVHGERIPPVRAMRSAAPERGERGEHERREAPAQVLVVEPEGAQVVLVHVGDEHVGTREQAEHSRAAVVGGEVGGHAALVGVEVEEEAAALRVRLAVAERAHAAGVVPFGRFDLDHVGAEVGEELAAVRAGHPLREFDDAEIVECGVRHRSLPPGYAHSL
ncbi:MAG: hypothetical protein F4X80_09155 [Chloroflexi bacterium]|nr:hypothetical protein [Chloroflexota bacterium]